jgi:hypothetical protein
LELASKVVLFIGNEIQCGGPKNVAGKLLMLQQQKTFFCSVASCLPCEIAAFDLLHRGGQRCAFVKINLPGMSASK